MKKIEYTFMLLDSGNFALILNHAEVQNDIDTAISGSLNVLKKQFLIKTVKGNFLLEDLDYKTINFLTNKSSPVYESMLVLVSEFKIPEKNSLGHSSEQSNHPFNIMYKKEFLYKVE